MDCLPEDVSEDVRSVSTRLTRKPVDELKSEGLRYFGEGLRYWDTLLRSDDAAYASFVRDLLSRELISLQSEQPFAQVGIFSC